MAAPVSSGSFDLWDFLKTLGPRTTRRPTPRFAVVLAATAGLVGFFGVVMVALDGLSGGDEPSKVAGVVISLLASVGGVALVTRFPTSPLATSGAVLGGLSIVTFWWFAFRELEGTDFVG